MDIKKDLTVFIGRFSPFHVGHAAVLRRALQTSKAVVVLVGSSGLARTTKNPFTFEERQRMIYSWAVQVAGEMSHSPSLIIKPIYDYMYNDAAWIRGVQDAVDETKNQLVDVVGINPSVYLTGANRDESTWYLRAFGDFFKEDVISQADSDIPFDLSATKIRNVLFSWRDPIAGFALTAAWMPETTISFLSHFVTTEQYALLVKEYEYLVNYAKKYEGLEYPVSIQCVDTCVVQSGHVLVVVRDNFPGKGLWALPGGHLEVDRRERLQDAAIRELQEETNIGVSTAQLYGSVKSKECFDHPDRSLKARVITMCYLLELDHTKTLPKTKPQRGEVKKVMWLPIAEGLRRRDMWFDDHHSMFETMYGRLGSN